MREAHITRRGTRFYLLIFIEKIINRKIEHSQIFPLLGAPTASLREKPIGSIGRNVSQSGMAGQEERAQSTWLFSFSNILKIYIFSAFSSGGIHGWGILLVISLEFQGIKHQPFFYDTAIGKRPHPPCLPKGDAFSQQIR
ncbi:hypothetical protein [uncultured Bilophila sp.]|uniref:hypothetical protein n=1 Tax=uncultured Bilophila sp. TaxID=529385 RepID=UPI00280BEB6A|nr:hypothetical protein [uncultured Bilophila sp.]